MEKDEGGGQRGMKQDLAALEQYLDSRFAAMRTERQARAMEAFLRLTGKELGDAAVSHRASQLRLPEE